MGRTPDVAEALGKMTQFTKGKNVHRLKNILRKPQDYRRDNVLFLLDFVGQGIMGCRCAYKVVL
jgi:hypothetical protein